MSFFGVPLSGLVASQNQLQSISNNLANISTDGYKDQNVTFADLFAGVQGQNGSSDPIQTGLGVKTTATTSDFTDGATTSTGISSNMAISGTGFFEVQSKGGTVSYTRAGDFTTNNAGQMVDPSGNLVMGYPAVNGVVQTSAALQPINVGSGVTIPAVASTLFSLSANLGASAVVSSVPTPSLSSPVAVFDSLGTEHTLSVAYTKTSANTWSYQVTIPSAELTAGATGATTLATGTMNFNTAGILTSVAQTTPTAVPAGPPGTIAITTGTANLADGAAPMTVKWNLLDSSGNPTITQTSAASATAATSTDGSASGILQKFDIGSDGTVEGTFSSGTIQALGQVALASFTNLQGLVHIGNNDYQSTIGSGLASVGVAGTGGRGTITGGSVEASNVNVAAEFAKMIVAQQAYQGDAKVVTTFDQISQATIAMIPA
ncbi:MAG TPA: flagellar hook-basal body complex protein [Acidobacteriaceae bacterium]